jgi:hypothetical protein
MTLVAEILKSPRLTMFMLHIESRGNYVNPHTYSLDIYTPEERDPFDHMYDLLGEPEEEPDYDDDDEDRMTISRRDRFNIQAMRVVQLPNGRILIITYNSIFSFRDIRALMREMPDARASQITFPFSTNGNSNIKFCAQLPDEKFCIMFVTRETRFQVKHETLIWPRAWLRGTGLTS